MTYTVDDLRRLADVRAVGCNTEPDDIYASERENFTGQVDKFLDWITSMEKKGRVENILRK